MEEYPKSSETDENAVEQKDFTGKINPDKQNGTEKLTNTKYST